MTERTADASPKLKARIAGCLYLIIIVGPLFSPFFASIMRSDAAATAARIRASESLYRLGGADALIVLACDLAVALIFYELLRPVSRGFALLAAFFRLAYVAINGANLINYFAPLLLLGGAGGLTAFKPDQAQALALTFIRLQATGFDVALAFFGVHVAMLGYLLFRSTFFPRILGVLLAIGGLSYLINSFANLISPAFGALLFPYILLPGGVAEISLAMWLVIVGVNGPRWKLLASATEASGS